MSFKKGPVTTINPIAPPLPDIIPVRFQNEKQLSSQLESIDSTLSNISVVDERWKERQQAVRLLHGLAIGSCSQHPLFMQFLSSKHYLICKQFADKRAVMVKETALALASIAIHCKTRFEPVIDSFIEDVMKLVGSSNIIMRESGHTVMIAFLQFCPFTKTLPVIYKTVCMKNAGVHSRQRSAEYIRFIIFLCLLQEYNNGRIQTLTAGEPRFTSADLQSIEFSPTSLNEKHLDLLEQAIVAMTTDADSNVRAIGRQTYCIFCRFATCSLS